MKSLKDIKTPEDLRKMDEKSLREYANEARNKLFEARYKVKAGQSKQSGHIKYYKKAVAQAETQLTVLRNAAPAAATEAPAPAEESNK